jgi:hypothetical protein
VGTSQHGWIVDPAVAQGDVMAVKAHVALETTMNPTGIDIIEKAMASPDTAASVPELTRQTIGEVDPSEQDALLHRMIGQSTRDFVELDFELAQHDGRYQVRRLVLSGIDVTAMLPEVSAQQHESAPSHIGSWMGYVVGVLIGAGLVAAVIVRIALRGARR